VSELGAFLLPVVPLLGLLVFLLLGRYPGCETIVRFSERISARRGLEGGRATAVPPPQAPRASAPAGGLLIALGLAQRPPPLSA